MKWNASITQLLKKLNAGPLYEYNTPFVFKTPAHTEMDVKIVLRLFEVLNGIYPDVCMGSTEESKIQWLNAFKRESFTDIEKIKVGIAKCKSGEVAEITSPEQFMSFCGNNE